MRLSRRRSGWGADPSASRDLDASDEAGKCGRRTSTRRTGRRRRNAPTGATTCRPGGDVPGDDDRIEDAWGAKADRLTDIDPETGEAIEDAPDRIALAVAVRRGSAPVDAEDSVPR
jgi:hypothetical protein